jgi:predicted dehydrogenase
LLDYKCIQRVVVLTPDLWYPQETIRACVVGKDVYVEKRMTLFIQKGRWRVKAVHKYDPVVQVGTMQRSDPDYHPRGRNRL